MQRESEATPGGRPLRRLFALLAALPLLAAAIWWLGPWSADFRYSRSDLVSLRRHLDSNPRDARAWRHLALRLAGDGDAGLAEPALRQALTLNPSDPDLGTGLGELLLETGRDAEAFQVLRAVVERHPKYPLAHRALGRLYQRKGSHLHAVTEFEAAVAADPQFTDAWYALALSYLERQQIAKARAAIATALRQSPREPEYLALKGNVEAAVGNLDAGIAAARSAADLAPRNVKIQINLANLLLLHHRSAEDLNEAERAVARVEQLEPGNRLLPFQRGELERLRGNWRASALYLEKAIATAPEMDKAYFSLSQVYRRSGRSRDAERMLAVYTRRQELWRRINEVRIGLGSRPDDIALYARLVDLQLLLGDRAAARDSLRAALQRAPNAPPLQRRLRALQNESDAAAAPATAP